MNVMDVKKSSEVLCSFCLRNVDEVDQMITGCGVRVCDECISMCIEKIAVENVEDAQGLFTRTSESLREKALVRIENLILQLENLREELEDS